MRHTLNSKKIVYIDCSIFEVLARSEIPTQSSCYLGSSFDLNNDETVNEGFRHQWKNSFLEVSCQTPGRSQRVATIGQSQ